MTAMPAASVRLKEHGLFARKGEAHPALAANVVAALPTRLQPAQRRQARGRPDTGLAALIRRSDATCELAEWPIADTAIREGQRMDETTTVDLSPLTLAAQTQPCQPAHPTPPSLRRQMTVRLEPAVFQRLETVRAEGGTTYQTLLEQAVRRLVFGQPTDAADSPTGA